MTVVVDASAALAWLTPSQATAAGWRFLGAFREHELIAPPIFDWEVRNVLLSLARRAAIQTDEYDEALATYEALRIAFVEPAPDVAGLAMLARQAGLSLFDAAYLALALDHDCGLASRDAAQLRIAEASGIECFDLRDTE